MGHSGHLPCRSSRFRIAVRLRRAVGCPPSGVELVPVAIAPVLSGGVVAFPAVRTKAVVHPLVLREVFEGQPIATRRAALVGLLRDHARLSCECLTRGVLARGLRCLRLRRDGRPPPSKVVRSSDPISGSAKKTSAFTCSSSAAVPAPSESVAVDGLPPSAAAGLSVLVRSAS
jgi:hypothetical protein